MVWFVVIVLLIILPFLLKGRIVRKVTWPLLFICFVLLLISPIVYHNMFTVKPILSKVTIEKIDVDNRRMMKHMIVENVAAYEKDIVAHQRFNINVAEINIFANVADAHVYYYVESTEQLTDEIDVTLYKRPYTMDRIRVDQVMEQPQIVFEDDELQFIGQATDTQTLYQLRTFSKINAVDLNEVERQHTGISSYFAYIRVPQKLRIYDVEGYRFQQGGMIDD